MADARIIVLEGDETGQELLEQSIRVLDSSVTQVEVELEHYDLSLDNRRSTSNDVVHTAARAMREGAENLGVEFDEHVAFVVAALEPHAERLGLAGGHQ